MTIPNGPPEAGSCWASLVRWSRCLARTGTLRFGAKSWSYTSGKDRPLESVFPDVFDAARDVPHIHEIGKGAKGEEKG